MAAYGVRRLASTGVAAVDALMPLGTVLHWRFADVYFV